MTLDQMHQVARWFQYTKDELDHGTKAMAWSWANQGHNYILDRIREEERRSPHDPTQPKEKP